MRARSVERDVAVRLRAVDGDHPRAALVQRVGRGETAHPEAGHDARGPRSSRRCRW